MSNVSLSSQQLLTQALAQLNSLNSSSPVTKQATEIIVQHLAGGQLTLQNPKNNRVVSLGKVESTEKSASSALSTGKSYFAAVHSKTTQEASSTQALQYFLNLFDAKTDTKAAPSKAIASFKLTTEQAEGLQPLLKTELSKTVSEGPTQKINSNLHQSSPLTVIQDLIRRLTAHAGSPSDAIRAIENALTDSSIVKTPATKALFEQIIRQINQGAPQGHESDVQKLKQLLLSPALSMSADQLARSATGPGMLEGLTRLLQMTLTARLSKNQPMMTERLSQMLSSLFEPAQKLPSAQLSKSLNDIQQLDQKHLLLQQLGKILSQFQSTKLLSAEQRLLGQDTLYFVLPTGVGEARRDVELLIKRESNDEKSKQKTSENNSTWHLTMKLMIGELGEMLTKVRLHQDTLEIDFYASNDLLKRRVNEFTPLLVKRLQTFGINLSATQCQLGKIPETLMTRPYQLFETQA